MEKTNSDFEGSRKEFWMFVSNRTKSKKRGIAALKNSAGVTVTGTKGKLEVMQSHYQCSGLCSVDEAFDWKHEVDALMECEECMLDR